MYLYNCNHNFPQQGTYGSVSGSAYRRKCAVCLLIDYRLLRYLTDDREGVCDLVKDEVNRQLQAKWADLVRSMHDVGGISAVSLAVQDCAPQAVLPSGRDTHSRRIHTDIGKGIFTAVFLSSNRYARHSRRTIEKNLLATILN